MSFAPIERRIRMSGFLIAAGLFVQILTLCWTHPLAFLSFILIGCPIVAFGILFFLYSLVLQPSAHGAAADRQPVLTSRWSGSGG